MPPSSSTRVKGTKPDLDLAYGQVWIHAIYGRILILRRTAAGDGWLVLVLGGAKPGWADLTGMTAIMRTRFLRGRIE